MIIIVDGKEIEVSDDFKRDSPSSEYESVHADLFDVESIIEKAKKDYLEKYGSTLSEKVEEAFKILTIENINKTIEETMEKNDLYRDYTKENCNLLVEKYENILGEIFGEKMEIEKKLEKYKHLLGEDGTDNRNEEEKKESEALFLEWQFIEQKEQKYAIILEDYQKMYEEAK